MMSVQTTDGVKIKLQHFPECLVNLKSQNTKTGHQTGIWLDQDTTLRVLFLG